MKRASMLLLAGFISAGVLWAAYENAAPPAKPLSPWFPAGPLLYLEAKDFSSLLNDWNSSPEKRIWIEGSNYEVFSRSRLFLRLKNAGDQFAVAAGLPPDMNFLSQVAGGHSALALYDIGNLQFLYISYLPSASSMRTTLWQMRAKFEPRSAAGMNFYLRRDPQSGKEVAFAISGDYLLLATREDLLTGALQLISGAKDRTVEAEPWWSQSVVAAGPAGDLRMAMNLEKLVPSPYFRTYWVQQNITDMKQYSVAISDLFHSHKEYREERVLIANNAQPVSSESGAQAAADIVRLVPGNSGIYEAKASPTIAQCVDLLETKLLAPHLAHAPASQVAPDVQLTSGESGSGSDLETRINQAPVRVAVSNKSSPVQALLQKSQVLASLQVQSTELDRNTSFVRIHSAVVLLSSEEWNQAEVEDAFSNFVAPTLTAGKLGVLWQQKSGYRQFDGLWPLSLAIRGKYLFVADTPELIEDSLSNLGRSTETKPALFIAGFNHGREAGNFSRFTRLLDQTNSPSTFSGPEHQPPFFSKNIDSLSEALSHVSSERIIVRSDGPKTFQTVSYELSE